jgi:quercetin dioxygenase-like cupin family protein
MKTCKVVTIDEGIKVTIEGMTGNWKRLILPEDTDKKEVMGVGFLKQGDCRGWHKHPKDEDEILYIIEGKALLEWKEDDAIKELIAQAGSAVYTPAEIENNISNPFPEDMYCAFFIRLKPEI